MKFNEKLKKAMKDLGLKQVQVAGMTGCSRASVSQWLSGVNIPSMEKQRDIAVSIGLDPLYFQKDGSEKVQPVQKGLVRKILPEDAARALGIDKQTLRRGLQQGVFPWGYAVKMENRWVYLINADRMASIEGIAI